jgi:hypothetical protein
MSCLSAITQAIANTCSNVPSAGLEVKGWIFNRDEFTITVDGSNAALITAITPLVAQTAFTITAVKKENNAGFDAVIADNLPDLYNHYSSIQPYERDSDAVKNIDEMDDVFIVWELKGPKTEGCFVILGLERGLHKSSGSGRFNDNNGIPTYEFTSRDGESEKYSRFIFWDTDYATTLAALVALE